MTSNNPELFARSDSNSFVENTVTSLASEARLEPPKMMNGFVEEKSDDEGRTAVSSSSNPAAAPSILIDKYEEEESNPNPALAETDYQSDVNSSSGQFALTNNNSGAAEIKRNSDQDVDTEPY